MIKMIKIIDGKILEKKTFTGKIFLKICLRWFKNLIFDCLVLSNKMYHVKINPSDWDMIGTMLLR